MMKSADPAPSSIPATARRVLVLQGGGALGSYQAGAYQALCHFDFEPDWIAGISIGAINAAIIAGNAPEQRVKRLKEFWEMVSAPVPWNPVTKGDRGRSLFNETSAALIATFGVPGFFTPRLRPDQRSEVPPQRRRGQCDHGQFQIFRQFRIQEPGQENWPGAHYGVRRP